jgi:PleD family two-component response regulator
MVSLAPERILLIADGDRQLCAAIERAAPSAQVTSVASIFDGVAELAEGSFTTIFAAAAPIERRPEAAVRTLRELAGDSRLLLFGNPTLEPLTRKMLDFGADDYIVTPVQPAELEQLFGQPRLRLARSADAPPEDAEPRRARSDSVSPLLGLPLADILLDSLIHHPHNARAAAVVQINSRLGSALQLDCVNEGQALPAEPDDGNCITHAIRAGSHAAGHLVLHLPKDEDHTAARHVLGEIAGLFGKMGVVQDTHRTLQRLVMTDELTGAYNGRYFKHFLNKICEKATEKHFFVTLLLFDIDNFKKYNDDFGHGVGDEILKQTALVMRECCREHDVVARISGDEFAVVFWDKEGPRQPREPRDGSGPAQPARPPHAPAQVFERFRRKIASPELRMLGATGQGTLTISGGLAEFPWEARTPEELIDLADKRLMFGAKKCGKDSLFLVGGENPGAAGVAPQAPTSTA